jgi:protein-S-isoprenylcysteine O-methyltransferase Ste14
MPVMTTPGRPFARGGAIITVTIIRAVRGFAWAGAVAFVGALGFFLFSYWLRFSGITPGPARPGPILWDTALFSMFALHHSVFAREPVRAWVARAVPRGLERSFYVWAASLLLIAVCALWQPVGGVLWQLEGPARWAMVALQLAAIWLTIHSAAIIDVLDLAGVRPSAATAGPQDRTVTAGPQNRTRPTQAVEFRTTGPYGWVRHPIYSGWFLLVFCVGTMTTTRLVFAVVSCAYVLIAIPFEERSLRATTGGAYDRYARQVKWKLVPGLY